ncbi:MAG: aldo/keto reductase [Pseudonocardiales bacterium]|nr:aldo/keto reductase [Pseudonocardiales bacterium]
MGEAIAHSGLERDAVFVTTKVNNNRQSQDEILASMRASNTALGLEQADLFLIHWPLPTVRDYVEAWRAMEAALADGLARSIGVSNFQEAHLRRLLDETDVVPAVNQIEAHPYLTQDALRAFGESHGIATEAWSPIAQGAVLDDPTITVDARRDGRRVGAEPRPAHGPGPRRLRLRPLDARHGPAAAPILGGSRHGFRDSSPDV